ncbi:MAG: PA14 domain-containing protein, partial [bacterium]
NIPDGWQNRSITVVLTRDDGPLGSGFDRNGRTYYSTDGSEPTNIGTTFTLTESGIYTIRYYSVDDVGNVEPVHTRNAYIDKIPPIFGAWSVPDISDTTTGGMNISVVVTDTLSGLNTTATRLQYGIGSSSSGEPNVVGWTDFATGTNGTLTLNWRSYGTMYLYLRCIAVDNAGNSATSPVYVEYIQRINRAPICYDMPDQTIYEKINCGASCEFMPGAIGYYYNLPADHPEVEGPITGVVRGDNPFNHDWYSPRYFVFSRLDRSLNFGDSWWPVNTGLPGDPQYFAVHWVTTLFAPATGTYSFRIVSDDDAWAYIDGRLVADNGGIHPMTACYWSTTLTKGYHTLHIYFAERHRVQSGFIFESPGLIYGVFPDECVSAGEPTEFACINLDDYVSDDSPD